MIAGLEARLADLAAAGRTVSYGALARDLGLTGPGTIACLTAALETLMESDAAAGHPFRAAVLRQRLGELPAPGFFAKAAFLGRYDGHDATAFIADERAALCAMFPAGTSFMRAGQ